MSTNTYKPATCRKCGCLINGSLHRPWCTPGIPLLVDAEGARVLAWLQQELEELRRFNQDLVRSHENLEGQAKALMVKRDRAYELLESILFARPDFDASEWRIETLRLLTCQTPEPNEKKKN